MGDKLVKNPYDPKNSTLEKMHHEIFEAGVQAQLKAVEAERLDRPDREKIASDILKVWYPNDEYKELDGSMLILVNMKCFAVADYILALKPTEEEIRRAVAEKIKAWFVSHRGVPIEKRHPDSRQYYFMEESEWQAFWEE